MVIKNGDNISSSHANNLKNNVFVLSEWDNFSINGSFIAPEKNSINFSKENTKCCWSLHFNASNSYLLGNEKEKFKFKAHNKIFNFSTKFCLESISNGSTATKYREVSLNRNMYDFSVYYNTIDKSNILNTY